MGSGWVSYPTLLSCLLYKQLLNLLNLIEVTLGEVITRLPTQSEITQKNMRKESGISDLKTTTNTCVRFLSFLGFLHGWVQWGQN